MDVRKFLRRVIELFVAYGAVDTVAFLCKKNEVPMYEVSSLLLALFVAFFLLIEKAFQGEKRKQIFSFLFGILLSTSIVFGTLIERTHAVFAGEESAFEIIARILLLAFPLTAVFSALVTWIDKRKHQPAWKLGYEKLSVKKFTIIAFVVIFLAWIPVWLCFYPCIYGYDVMSQMHLYLHLGDWSNYQPIIHTLMLGACQQIGFLLGGTNTLGMAIYAVIQMLLLDGAITYMLSWLYQNKSKGTWGMLVWYAIFPIHPILAISTTKDIVFSALTLVFTVYTFKYLDRKPTKKSLIGMVLLTTVMLLFRNNALYAIVVAGIILVWFWKSRRKALLILLLVTLGITKIADYSMMTVTDATKGPKAEMLCIPLQQMARVAQVDLESVSDYISEDAAKAYNESFADPVKWHVSDEMFEDMGAFLKNWFEVGMDHKKIYIDAFIAMTAGYWYLDDWYINGRAYLQVLPQNTPGDALCNVESSYVSLKIHSEIERLFSRNEYPDVPILSMFCSVALYLWIFVFYIFYMLYEKRWNYLLPIVFLSMYFLTLLLGPVVLVRYAYPFIIAVPMLIAQLFQGERLD